jgi:uncharacterized protein (TIGR03435 family)
MHNIRSIFSIIVLLLTASSSFAQTAPGPTFEVATIKLTATDTQKLAEAFRAGQAPAIGARITQSQATYTFMSLKELIVTAYDVKPSQVVGPSWLNDGGTPRFDIIAKLPDGANASQAPRMLQALLAERFKLVLHQATKEQSVMALVVASGGPKLQETAAADLKDIDPDTPLKPGERQMDTPQGPARMTVDPSGGAVINMGKRGTWIQTVTTTPVPSLHLEGKGVTMSGFADILAQVTATTGGGNVPIVDMTGLKGNYVVSVDLSLQDLLKMAQAAGLAVPNAPQQRGGLAAEDPGGASLSDAVKAYGLKLESRKAPQDQLIIDMVEKTPTEN